MCLEKEKKEKNPSTGHENNKAQPKADKCPSSTSHFPPFNCCLSVILYLNKGDYLKNVHVLFCPNKWRSFEPFLCLDLTNAIRLLLSAYGNIPQRVSEGYLKVGEEAVQFLLAGPLVKVLATGVQQHTHQSQTQQVLWRVQGVRHFL